MCIYTTLHTLLKNVAIVSGIAVASAVVIKLLDSDEWSMEIGPLKAGGVEIGPLKITGSKRNGEPVSEAYLNRIAKVVKLMVKLIMEAENPDQAAAQVKSFMEALGFDEDTSVEFRP